MKEVERILAASLAISSLALVLAIVCFPLLQFNLNSLTNLVHKDIDEFKNSTDLLWRDLILLEGTVLRDKRDDAGYFYQYKPTLKKKVKKIHTALFHLHFNKHRNEVRPKAAKRLLFSTNSTLIRRRTHPKWGRKIKMGTKGTIHRPTKIHRVFAAPNVEVKERPGKKLFTDSEYIGSLVPMDQKEEISKSGNCKMKLIPNPKCPPGVPGIPGKDGEDGVNGEPGLDGLPGEDGTSSEQNEKCILCPEGEPGDKGPPGPAGETGKQGPRGRPGVLTELPGPRGPPGPKGEPGEPGIRGPRGQMGISVKKWICPPGEKGPQGPKGPLGPSGPKGDEGEMGIQGVRGRKGPIGAAGPPGSQGEQGLKGPEGRVGFELHYCECPARSKGVRGKFQLPEVPSYVSEDAQNYPRNIFVD